MRKYRVICIEESYFPQFQTKGLFSSGVKSVWTGYTTADFPGGLGRVIGFNTKEEAIEYINEVREAENKFKEPELEVVWTLED